MRAKFIYEKFSEESDPIRDLGIGITYNKILDWAKEQGYINGLGWIHNLVSFCIRKKRIDFVEYLLNYYDFNLKELHIFYKVAKDSRYEECAKLIRTYITKWNLGESLNEKFVEDSDPVNDLGIGIMNQIKKFIIEKEDRWSPYYDNDINRLLERCAFYEQTDYVDFLISKGANPIYDEYCILRVCAFNEKYDMVKYLVKTYNIDIDKAIEASVKNHETMTPRHLKIIKLQLKKESS